MMPPQLSQAADANPKLKLETRAPEVLPALIYLLRFSGSAARPGYSIELWDGKIVVLVLRRNEAETVLPWDGLDCHAPIGAVLGDRSSDSIV